MGVLWVYSVATIASARTGGAADATNGRKRGMKRGIFGATMAAMTTTPTPPDSLTDLRDLTRQFARERDWAPFHTPKNLAMALSVEVAELVEHYQWLPTGVEAELDDAARVGIRHELADVLLYLVQLADKHGVDLHAAALEKIQLNAIKYPPGPTALGVKSDIRTRAQP